MLKTAMFATEDTEIYFYILLTPRINLGAKHGFLTAPN